MTLMPNEHDRTAALDLRVIDAKLPLSVERADERRRTELFASFDASSNGILKLNEVDRGLRSLLGNEFVSALAPAIPRAFHAA